ncbi:MAG: iron ABC transporter permease [Chitinophagaceae bacterium]
MKQKIIYLSLTVALAVSILLSLSIGAMPIPLKDIVLMAAQKIHLPIHYTADEVYQGVIGEIRLPRTILSVSTGAALGISGAAVQGIFRNPLAEPGLIGISSGASLAAAFIIALEPVLFVHLGNLMGHYLLALGAFVGGALAAFAVYQISKSDGTPLTATMLLAGIAINALCGALTGLFSFIADEQQLRSITFWMMGSLAGATWQAVWGCVPFITIALLLLPRFAKPLNTFALGEVQTNLLGMQASKVKNRIVLLATLAVGVSVAFTGIISFVGLLVPHILRMVGVTDNRFVLPASALLGALTLTLSDLLARTVIAPMELPIGIVTAILGTPVFLYILIKDKKKLYNQ